VVPTGKTPDVRIILKESYMNSLHEDVKTAGERKK
jgi:hypothetical protein